MAVAASQPAPCTAVPISISDRIRAFTRMMQISTSKRLVPFSSPNALVTKTVVAISPPEFNTEVATSSQKLPTILIMSSVSRSGFCSTYTQIDLIVLWIVKITQDGNNPLSISARKATKEVAQLLLEANAAVDVQNQVCSFEHSALCSGTGYAAMRGCRCGWTSSLVCYFLFADTC